MNLIGPKKKPSDFGFGPGDSHIVINDVTGKAKAFDHLGKPLWVTDCLAQGVAGPDWRNRNADTPPGLYKLGAVYRDYEAGGPHAGYSRDRMAFGWYSFDLVELEDQERKHGRAGVMIHGGGSACGWPGAWAPHQSFLAYTHGCVRMYNKALQVKVLPLYERGTVYVSVYQDAP